MRSINETSETQKNQDQIKESAVRAVAAAIDRHAKLGEEVTYLDEGSLKRGLPETPPSRK